MMRLGNWSWLIVLAAMVPFAIFVLWFSHRRYRKRMQTFIAAGLFDRLIPKRGQGVRRLKNFLMITGICFVILALVRPMRTEREEEVRSPGVDFLIALDLSRSMLVRDMPGGRSRLDFSKEAIRELVKKLSADRVGMIGFAGEARLMVPPTMNYPTFELVLRNASPESIGFQGSDMERVINVAADRLKREEKKARILIIISDGETLSGDAMMAARQANIQHQLVIFTVGVGTPEGGKIPMDERDLAGNLIKTEYLKDIEEKEVVSKLDEVTLRNISQMTGGGYAYLSRLARGSDQPNALVRMFQDGVRPLAKSVRISKITSYEELYQIPLLIGLAFLLLDMLIGGRRFKAAQPGSGTQAAVTLILAGFLVAAGVSVAQEPAPAVPSEKVELENLGNGTVAGIEKIAPEQLALWRTRNIKQAREFFDKGKMEDASKVLQQALLSAPDDIYLLYNFGIVCYAKGGFQEAEAVWSRISPGRDPSLDAAARFQSGNAAFRIAQALPMSQRMWDSAIMYYRRAQEYYLDASQNPGYADSAKKNSGLVLPLISGIYESAINHYLKETTSFAQGLQEAGPGAKIWQLKDRIDGVVSMAQKTEFYLAELRKADAQHPLVPTTELRLLELMELGFLAKARFAFEEIKRNATPQNHAWTVAKHQESISYYDQVLKLNAKNEDARKERLQVMKSARDTYLLQADVEDGLAKRISRIVAEQRGRAARMRELEKMPSDLKAMSAYADLEETMRIVHIVAPGDDPEDAIRRWVRALEACDTAHSFGVNDDLAEGKKQGIMERAINYRKQLAREYYDDALQWPFKNDEDADHVVKLLELAAGHLQKVKDLNPTDAADVQKDLAAIRNELANRYVRRGDIYWEMGKAKRVTHPDRGVAFLEKADQDFGFALAINPELREAKEKRNTVRSVMLDWRVELSKHIAKMYEKEKEEALAGKVSSEPTEEVNLKGLREMALQEQNLEERYAGSAKPPEPIFNW